jgi:hypothetical protein
MISALVLSPTLHGQGKGVGAPEAVARSLGSLVRAIVEGVLRDAAIIGPAGDNLGPIAEEAGCGLIETSSLAEGLAQGLAQMRGDVAFVLLGGYAPPAVFIQEAGDLLMEGVNFPGAVLRCAPDSLLTRLAPGLARPVGALALRRTAQAAAARDLADLIRAAKIRRALTGRALRLAPFA